MPCSVFVRLSKFCQPSPRGGKSIWDQKKKGVPRKPKWNCTFKSNLYGALNSCVKEETKWKHPLIKWRPFNISLWRRWDSLLLSLEMWGAWKWFVDASQVFEFEKIKCWCGRRHNSVLPPLSLSLSLVSRVQLQLWLNREINLIKSSPHDTLTQLLSPVSNLY